MNGHVIDINEPITHNPEFANQSLVEDANELIRLIGSHGRRFFWSTEHQRFASMDLDARGRVWFVDDCTGTRIFTHLTRGRWRGFSHGGTMRSLVDDMRDYIMLCQPVPRWRIATKQMGDPTKDVWGYGLEAAEALRMEAFKLPIIECAPTPQGERDV
jgi:hypothetical protein